MVRTAGYVVDDVALASIEYTVDILAFHWSSFWDTRIAVPWALR